MPPPHFIACDALWRIGLRQNLTYWLHGSAQKCDVHAAQRNGFGTVVGSG